MSEFHSSLVVRHDLDADAHVVAELSIGLGQRLSDCRFGLGDRPIQRRVRHMTKKTITGYLVVDWKAETHRTRKSKPSATDLGSNEVIAELDIEVRIPEVDVPTLGVAIDVPEANVHAATLEALSDEELPDWSDAAAEIVADHDEEIEAVGGPGADPVEVDALVKQLTTEVLSAVDTRPPVDQVREVVADMAAETAYQEQDVAGGDGGV